MVDKNRVTYMISPKGEKITVPDDEVKENQALGWRIATPDEVSSEFKVKEDKEIFGGTAGTATALAAGGLRGFTFGLSDAAMRAGGIDAETIAKTREYNPVASTVGEVAGAVAPAAFGVGLPGLVGKAGTAAEGLASRVIGQNIWGRIGSKALGSAVEGAFYGAGQGVTEAALTSDKQSYSDIAEKILANTATGALFGGVVGGGTAAIGEGMSALGRAGRSLLQKGNSGLQGSLQEGGLGKKILDKATALRTGVPEDDVSRLTANAGRLPGNRRESRELIDEFTNSLQRITDETRTATMDTTHAIKPEFVQKQLKNANGKAIQAEAFNVADEIEQQILQLRQNDVGGSQVKLLEKWHNRLTDKLLKADEDAFTAFMILDDAKRELSKDLDSLFKVAKKNSLSTEEDMIYKVARNSEKRIKNLLTNETVFGDAAVFQAEANDIIYRHLTNKKNLGKSLSKDKDVAYGGKQEVVNFKKVRNFLNKIDDNPDVSQELNNVLETSQEAVNFFRNAESKGIQINKEILKNFEDDLSSIARVTETFQLLGIQKEINTVGGQGVRGIGRILTTTIPAAIGGAVLGPAGAAIPMALAAGDLAITNPVRTMQVLSAVERQTQRVTNAIGSSVGTITRPITRSAGQAYIPAWMSVYREMTPFNGDKQKKYDDKETQQAFYDRVEELQGLLANRAQTEQALQQNLSGLGDAAPQITQAVQTSALKALDFLASKVPMTYTPNLFQDKRKVPSAEIAKFARYTSAIENPMTVLKDLENGIYNAEGVEVLQQVYPSLYRDVKNQLMDRMSEVAKLPFKQKVVISRFVGIPFSPGMTQQVVAPPDNQQQGNDRVRKTELKQIGQVQTDISRIQGK